jgi:hypothetical protein
LLNLPEKTAKRDIIHGVKHLEEIAEDWLCARRTLSILSVLARKWKINLPEEATVVFTRTDAKYGFFSTADVPSPKADLVVQTPPSTTISPPRVSQKPEQTANTSQNQNQLQQSLYSYLPDYRPAYSNGGAKIPPPQPSQLQQNMISPRQPSRQSNGIGSMNIANDSLLNTIPYPRNPYNNSSSRIMPTPSNDLPHSDSAVMSETSTTRQVSPSTMFGGVDALVESQDWWLRDQASLALGFDNWMGVGNNGDINGGIPGNSGVNMDTTSTDINPMAGMGSGFYMPTNESRGAGGDVYTDDDWNTYT